MHIWVHIWGCLRMMHIWLQQFFFYCCCEIDTTQFTCQEFKKKFQKQMAEQRPLMFLLREPKVSQDMLQKQTADQTIGLDGLPITYKEAQKNPSWPKVRTNQQKPSPFPIKKLKVETDQKLLVAPKTSVFWVQQSGKHSRKRSDLMASP